MKLKSLKIYVGYFQDWNTVETFPIAPIKVIVDTVNDLLSANEGKDLTIFTNNPYALTHLNNLFHNFKRDIKEVVDDSLPHLEVEHIVASFLDKNGFEHDFLEIAAEDLSWLNLWVLGRDEEEFISDPFHIVLRKRFPDE